MPEDEATDGAAADADEREQERERHGEHQAGRARHDAADGARAAASELRSLLRQLTTPVVESLDQRLRGQVVTHVDEVVGDKVDAAMRDRLSLVDRAIADLSRSVDALERRISNLERQGEPPDLDA